MSYISTENVKEIRGKIKKEFPDFKFSIRREHYSTVCVHIMQGKIDLPEHQTINPHYPDNSIIPEMANKILSIIGSVKFRFDSNAGDMGADYAGWNFFIDIAIGKWDKAYQRVA